MRRAVAGIVVTLTLGLSLPADAVANAAVAVPGSFLAGYATPVLVLSRSAPATFANLDLILHDIRSVANAPNNQPYFSSDAIGPGETASIDGLAGTPAGVYEFYCSLHETTMRGTAVVTG